MCSLKAQSRLPDSVLKVSPLWPAGPRLDGTPACAISRAVHPLPELVSPGKRCGLPRWMCLGLRSLRQSPQLTAGRATIFTGNFFEVSCFILFFFLFYFKCYIQSVFLISCPHLHVKFTLCPRIFWKDLLCFSRESGSKLHHFLAG